MEDLVPLIKDKKELRGLSDDFVGRRLAEYVVENPEFVEKYNQARDLDQFTRSSEYKDMLKSVRSKLREVYGAFILEKYGKIEEAVEELEEDQSVANHCKVLGMHRSSKERLPFYERLYEKIFGMTGIPERVLDLACGLNPFSYPFLGCEPEYLASDISPELCRYINRYFEMRQIEGEAFVFDLLEFEESEMSDYARSDVCFLFKTLDSLESLERDFSEELIAGLPADWIVASFARQSLGGGKTIYGKKPWFEDVLERNGLEFEFFQFQNESFYVIEK